MLSLQSFGVAFGPQVILADVTFSLREGMNLLVGPAGTGKTTLLRTLAGLNEAQPSLVTWGDATQSGSPVGGENRPTLMQQNLRLLSVSVRENLASGLLDRSRLTRAEQTELFVDALRSRGLNDLATRLEENVSTLMPTEQRLLAIVRAALGGRKVLMVDEPMMSLEPEGAGRVIELLRYEAERTPVLVVTHNQERARLLQGSTIFLAGGSVREHKETGEFFDSTTATGLNAEFLRTGRVGLPSLNADPKTLADDAPAPVRVLVPSGHRGPRGFYWLKGGALGGCPRPGVVASFEDDLEALQRLGCTVLVNLEEKVHYSEKGVASAGMQLIHSPIVDMSVPALSRGRELCRRLSRLVADGESVVVHCRAGLGRTGLLMAMMLLWDGESPADAFEKVRAINPRWIQSDEQLEFLPEFSGFLAAHGEGGASRMGKLTAEEMQ
ncbi:MAG: ATP-binding cassette domain-containing protein [Myxococcota bacterium]